jgi:hypothetical protein
MLKFDVALLPGFTSKKRFLRAVKQDRIDRGFEDDSAWIGGSSGHTPGGTVSTK